MSFLQFLPLLLLGEKKKLDKEELVREILKLKLGSAKIGQTYTEDALEKALLEVEQDLVVVARAKKIAEEALKFQCGKSSGPGKPGNDQQC